MSTALRIEPVDVARFDDVVLQLGWTRLTRTDDGVALECPDEEVDRARHSILRAGARVTTLADAPTAPTRAIPALVADLRPLRCDGVVDTVFVRPLDEREASARLWRGTRVWWLGRRRDRDGLRAILRGSDRLFAWRRIVWARAQTLRSRALRVARPAIFDREAIDRSEERFSLASQGQLTRWLLG